MLASMKGPPPGAEPDLGPRTMCSMEKAVKSNYPRIHDHFWTWKMCHPIRYLIILNYTICILYIHPVVGCPKKCASTLPQCIFLLRFLLLASSSRQNRPFSYNEDRLHELTVSQVGTETCFRLPG